ncbi:hypothetical protein [Chengkuizengella axinellae]|uniref:Uncharacterized protein n=1 Tax=Chengkuizengella axinellae TaxID=3064388 RepID=A0ABT9IWC9_9BACL|nr:hypothetical protein [Chengkuizengella sp. 2205SS18-9]MDP5273679.1 hypothetical protein [Chengkuizengella sp. 2205SS18-9]
MAISIDTFKLRPSDVISSRNAIFADLYKNMITTEFKARDDNPYQQFAGYGDAVISQGGIIIDEQFILSVGWGDGFAIKKIANDGTIAQLFYDYKPMNDYAYYNSIAVDKERSIAYIGNHANDNIAKYDYSDLKAGGSEVVKEVMTEESHNLPSDEIGHSYYNGLALAGDWLYIISDDRESTGQMRWNTQTQVKEEISVINKRNNGRYGNCKYSKRTNRIYSTWHSNGEIWITVDPETDTPITYNLRIESLGLGNDMRGDGIVEDNENPNHIWVVGYHRIAKIDITACITEPVELNVVPTLIGGSTQDLRNIPYWINGYPRINGGHPEYGSDFITIQADRGWAECSGWYDQEHNMPVAVSQRYGDFHFSHDPLTYDYACPPILITTENGTKYWIYTGYAWDGGRFHIYPQDIGYVLETDSELVLGDYTLSDGGNIQFAEIDNLMDYIPSECSIQYYVSNNAGETWESYVNDNQLHRFSSVGNQFRFKIMMSGTPIKCPHIQTYENITVSLFENTEFRPRTRRTSTRLRGGSK